MLYAFKDSNDGYYQIELAKGEALPEWAQSLTPCPVITPPEVVTAPQEVTRYQALAALHLAGLLGRVEAIMVATETSMLIKLAWQNAQKFERQSQMVLAIAEILMLSEQQLDDLFIAASAIK